MPRTINIKLTPELKRGIEDAIKETLCIGDALEIELKVTAIIYEIKADGCVNDVE